MEPFFSFPLMKMEVDNRFSSVPSSRFNSNPTPITGRTRPHSSPPPAPKHMTMRERAKALREARLKRLSTSSRSQSQRTEIELDEVRHDVSNEPITRQELAPNNAQKAAVVTQRSQAEISQELPQTLGPKRQGADGRKSQSRKENSATKKAETDNPAHMLTEPCHDESPDDTIEGGSEQFEAVLRGHNESPKAGSSKSTSMARADRGNRRKSATEAVPGKRGNDHSENDSGTNSTLLADNESGYISSRAQKKARIAKAGSPLPPKAPPKSQKKKSGTRAVQAQATATATAPSPQVIADTQQQGELEAPFRKRKSLRSSLRIVGEGSSAGVQDKKLNNSNAEPPSKDPQSLGTAEQDPKPHQLERQPRGRKSKRLMNRKRRALNPEESEPPSWSEAIMEEENESKAETDAEQPNQYVQPQRMTRSKRRDAKRSAPNEAESAKNANREDNNRFNSSRVNTPLRRSLRSAAKSKSPVTPPVEEKNKCAPDDEATDIVDVGEVKRNQDIPAEKEGHTKGSVNSATQSASTAKRTSPKERALLSVTKSKRFALSASQQGARFIQPWVSGMSDSRRQSLSHREGLSRLTSVVDQLQREGETFLETEHRICDQLMPFSSDSGSHKLSNLVQGYFGAAVSDDDRKAIADSALRDAVMHAKLQFQAKQRAAITELAENLVNAVKDWKNAKNTVLRDIIPEELRPEILAPVETFQQRMRAGDDVKSAPEISERSDAPNESGAVDDGEQTEGVNEDGAHKVAMDRDDDVTVDRDVKRRESICELRVLQNANDLKQFAGFSYSDLNLQCYRSCAILKLCEFEQGLSFEELYGLTPLGRMMLKRKLAFLVGNKYLEEREMVSSGGDAVVVYRTAPHIAERRRRLR